MREFQVVVRIRPIDIAAVGSILLHAALFLFVQVKPPADPLGPVSDAPLNVVLAPPQEEVAAPVAPPSPPAAPTPPAPPVARPPIVARRPAPLPPRFPPMPIPPPVAAPRIPAAPPEPVPGPPGPPVDMMASIESRRAQRRAAEGALARGNPSEAKRDPVERNLDTLSGKEGVGGVFQVIRKGLRTGEFAFNGFRGSGHRQWREVIEVDAGVGGDLEIAMIRRMIELIRTHYTGDFQWDSHRLGRVVVLSAARADQEGLEEFLMKEFFGTPVVKPGARSAR